MYAHAVNGVNYLLLGEATRLDQIQLDNQGSLLASNNRIPAGFANSVDNIWQLVALRDITGATDLIVAHAAPNLSAIDSSTERPIYSGSLTGTGALTALGAVQQSGGIVYLAPYLLSFGNLGRVDISSPTNPATIVNSARVCSSKIVYGVPTRGGGGGPSGLLWSLDSLVRASFSDPAAGDFAFDILSESTTVLSSRGIIEYDGIYYWPGVDRFQMFNGVVREIPNTLNINWFYDGLNFAQRQKVFAYKVPRFGEIWWCYPRGNATECTHAVIHNVRENIWYDTELPDQGRCDGYYAKIYSKPFMVDVQEVGSGRPVWQHETGVDKIDGSSVNPIRSYFETAEISLLITEQPQDKNLRCARVEPDFVQSGNMTLTIRGRSNSRSTTDTSLNLSFSDTASTPEEQVINSKEVRRLMSFRFESNVAGGDYQTGESFAFVEPAGGRYTK